MDIANITRLLRKCLQQGTFSVLFGRPTRCPIIIQLTRLLAACLCIYTQTYITISRINNVRMSLCPLYIRFSRRSTNVVVVVVVVVVVIVIVVECNCCRLYTFMNFPMMSSQQIMSDMAIWYNHPLHSLPSLLRCIC